MTRDKILATEYSEEFDEYRKNRSHMSYFKYGPIATNFGQGLVEALPSMQRCIDKYKETKNSEYLVDAANYLMFEFMYPSIEGAYFKATDSDGSAGIVGMSVKEIENFDK